MVVLWLSHGCPMVFLLLHHSLWGIQPKKRRSDHNFPPADSGDDVKVTIQLSNYLEGHPKVFFLMGLLMVFQTRRCHGIANLDNLDNLKDVFVGNWAISL